MKTSSAEARNARGPDAATISAIAAAVLGLALTVAAFAMFGSRAGLSVCAGAVLAIANLVAMSAIVRRVLTPADDEALQGDEAASGPEVDLDAELDARASAELDASASLSREKSEADHAAEGKRGGALWGAFGLAKIVVLFGGMYLLLTRGWVDPIALVVGYAVLPLGIAASSLVTGLSPAKRGAARRSVRK
jgi:hypothetical protein